MSDAVLLRRCARMLAQELFLTHTATQHEINTVEHALKGTIKELLHSRELLRLSGTTLTRQETLHATSHRVVRKLGVACKRRSLQRMPTIIAHTLLLQKK